MREFPSRPGGQGAILPRLLGPGRVPFLVACLLAAALGSYRALRIPVDPGASTMGSRDPSLVRARAELARRFGEGEELLLSATPPVLLSPEGISLIDELSGRIRKIPGVRRVDSLSDASRVVPGEHGPLRRPLVPRPFDRPGAAEKVREALDANPVYDGLLVSRDRRTAGLLVEIGEQGDGTIREIRDRMAEFSGRAELHLTGVAVQKHDVSGYIRRDQRVLVPLAAAVLCLILLLATRKPAGAAIPMASTAFSLALTLGLAERAGLTLNPITSMLSPVVMVLSVETAVHVFAGWQRGDLPGETGTERVAGAARRVFRPCLYSALTTAAGLLSLCASDIPAVRQFGIAGAAGVMISFAAGVTLVPVLLTFLPSPAGPSPRKIPDRLDRAVGTFARWGSSRPRTVLLAAGIAALLLAPAIPRIRNNTDLVRFLAPSAPLRRDTLFIDGALPGVNTLEFLVSRRDGAPLTSPGDVRRIEAFRESALAEPAVASVRDVTDPLRMLWRAESGGDSLALPARGEDLAYLFDLLSLEGEDRLVRRLATPDFRFARITVRVRSVGTSEAAPLADRLESRGRELFGAHYGLLPAGSYHQVVVDSNRLAATLARSFLLSLAVVLLLVHLLFRSVRFTLAAIPTNLLPLLAAAGLMGYAGIDLSTATAMIAAVALGLVVDNTIHYLSRYRREREAGAPDPLIAASEWVGRPLTVSALALVAGFLVGGFGSFRPTIHFSLLTGVAMLSALSTTLIVLPAILAVWEPTARGPRP